MVTVFSSQRLETTKRTEFISFLLAQRGENCALICDGKLVMNQLNVFFWSRKHFFGRTIGFF